jgi:hypothetical protein
VATESEKQADKRYLEHARMLVSLYFPRLQPTLDRFLSLRERFVAALATFKQGGKQPNREAAVQMDAALKEVEAIEEELRAALIQEARALDRSWWRQLPWLRQRTRSPSRRRLAA